MHSRSSNFRNSMSGSGFKMTTTVSPVVSKLSQEDDPRLLKLKKELQKLDIVPKPKYINFKF